MAKSVYWLDPELGLSAQGEAVDPIINTSANVALSLKDTYVDGYALDTYWGLGIPPLRHRQRDDSLGFTSGSPRLNTPGKGRSTSVQETRAPRLPEGGQSYS
jgi:hypothetical protein